MELTTWSAPSSQTTTSSWRWKNRRWKHSRLKNWQLPVGVVICGGVGAAVVPADWVCGALVGLSDDTAGEPAWGVEMNAVSPPAAFDEVEVW